MAWCWQLDGASRKGSLLLQLLLGIFSSFLIWVTWWFHYRTRRRPEHVLPVFRLPVELAGAFCVALTGHLGGFLIGVNG